jgi:ATP-dependent Lon protease
VGYVQAWLVGTSDEGAMLVPYEVAIQRGSSRISFSGPVYEHRENFIFAVWVARLMMEKLGKTLELVDLHVHFPLMGVKGNGVSSRLSFAHAVIEAFQVPTLFKSEETILTGNLTLNGMVLPVNGINAKYEAFLSSGLLNFVTSIDESENLPTMVKVAYLSELFLF